MPKYVATLRDKQTGDERQDSGDYPHTAQSLRFYWTEGNYSCDCNRAAIFGQEDCPCNTHDNRFELVSLKFGDRELLDPAGVQ